jgi:hypothetical protein
MLVTYIVNSKGTTIGDSGGIVLRLKVLFRIRTYKGRTVSMHVPVERFVGILDDYSIIFLQTCDQCRILITYQGQGHNCGGNMDTNETQRIEAEHFAQLMQRIKKLYVLPNFDAPRL